MGNSDAKADVLSLPGDDNACDQASDASRVALPLVAKLTAALLLIDAGVSLVDMIYQPLFHDRGIVDLTPLINIPLGYGLLRRNEKARGCVVWLAILCLAGMATLVAFMSVTYTGHLPPSWQPDVVYFTKMSVMNFMGVILAILLLMGFEVWVWRGLSSKRTKELFRHETSGVDARSWTWTLLLIGLLIGGGKCFSEHLNRQEIDSIKYIDAKFRLVDSETGEGLNSLRFSYTDCKFSTENAKTPDKSFDCENSTVHFHGLITPPLKYVLGSDGYESQEITLEPGTYTRTLRLVKEKKPVSTDGN